MPRWRAGLPAPGPLSDQILRFSGRPTTPDPGSEVPRHRALFRASDPAGKSWHTLTGHMGSVRTATESGGARA